MSTNFEVPVERCIRIIADNLEGYALARVPHNQYMDRPDLESAEKVAAGLLKQIVPILLEELVQDDYCSAEPRLN